MIYTYKISGLRFTVIATILKNGKGVEQKEFKGPHITKEMNANIDNIENYWNRATIKAEAWAEKRIEELQN